MARKFGATTTAKLAISSYTAINSLDLRTVAAWLNVTGNGNSAAGRIFDRASKFELYTDNTTVGKIIFEARRWVTTRGKWSIDTAISQNVMHHLAVTYDYGSTANDPVFYVDGVSVAITENTTPSGGKLGETETLYIGNRGANSRAWEDDLCECAWFDRILSADEIKTLMYFGPYRVGDGLVLYVPTNGVDSPEPNLVAGGNNATVTGTSQVDHAPSSPPFGVDTYRLIIPSTGAFTLTADTGTFTLTGIATGLAAGRMVAPVVATFTHTGIATGLAAGRKVNAVVGIFTETGIATALIAARQIAPVVGAFTLTGIVVTLTNDHPLPVTVGTFILTGIDVTLTFSGGHADLVADVANFTLTGIATGLAAGRKVNPVVEAFTLTGIAAGLAAGRMVAPVVGPFTLTGIAIDLDHDAKLVITVGAFTLTGVAVTLTFSGGLQFEEMVITDLQVKTSDIDALAIKTSDIDSFTVE